MSRGVTPSLHVLPESSRAVRDEAREAAVHRGGRAERIAAEYLCLRGFQILDQNRRAGRGEIDLIARDGHALVFVEVRMRRRGGWTSALASVDARKRERLRDCARALLRQLPELRWPGRSIRFDMIAIEVDERGLQLEHLPGVLV